MSRVPLPRSFRGPKRPDVKEISQATKTIPIDSMHTDARSLSALHHGYGSQVVSSLAAQASDV